MTAVPTPEEARGELERLVEAGLDIFETDVFGLGVNKHRSRIAVAAVLAPENRDALLRAMGAEQAVAFTEQGGDQFLVTDKGSYGVDDWPAAYVFPDRTQQGSQG